MFFSPIVSSRGVAASIAAASPPATMNSRPAAATSGRPNTGAATNFWVLLACASVRRSDKMTLIVLEETCRPPERRFAITPSRPRTTCSTASSFESMVITASPRLASAMLVTSFAPRAVSASAFAGVRLNTVTR